jgi:peptidoglycan hydrolase-like protein with peptidoglycan-binding domain
MVPLAAKLFLTGALLGLAAFSASKAKANTSELPPALVDAVTNAIASRDPGVMRAVALKLEQLGYSQTAADLRRTAEEVAAEKDINRTLTSVGAQPVQTVAPGTPASAAQTLASKLALNLQTTAPGRENKALVTEFQSAEGLAADGKYGVKTALALVKYGIVPPVPRVWPKGQEGVARAGFAAALRAQAATDPARSEEWLQAANAALAGAPKPSGSKLVSNTKAPLTEQEKKNVMATVYETGMQSAYEAGRPTAADRA